ncbi:GDP-mannose 4,6-dehydratase [Nocardioides psychrotolerans]|uniref:GDP-mannose 4,6-dehydratase n=1 Tax=Nocardioides psychrotolerans TaxID=1005945 RepID=A0A1I3N8S5_9ACTN|nr:GDP-mannose 4,6-dehydratase [Nocardioides psychrotolerans]GEP39802.1 GDP-mannose 4,6-dehydratase [Nocardioides psychrotolerans]SFJ05440.1 GDPmannose 4,6-dehydratase [Nocardioides psychrotolerans]
MGASRVALVTGVAGQDGVYLARELLSRGWRVVGTTRPGDSAVAAMSVYLSGVEVVSHDLRDASGFEALVGEVRPSRVFNLAGFSSVGASWDHASLVEEVNGLAVERMLTSLVELRDRHGDDVRFFQAGSAEETGAGASSPYAASKTRARAAVTVAREAFGLHAVTATLHNHESPLRPQRFVTRKITRAAASIACGLADSVSLGNLEVSRDWGAAEDYVQAMVAMLELDAPQDLVIATGVSHTLRDLLDVAFEAAGLGDPASYVVQDRALLRPADAPSLVADTEPARRVLGWSPSLSFEQVVGHMVRTDLERLRSGVEESPAYLSPS